MQNGFSRIGEMFLSLCEDVNSPISLGLWLRFKYDQKSLAEFELPTRDYVHWSAFERDYLCVEYLSKYKGLSTGINLEEAALQKFESSELGCRETNERLRRFRNGHLLDGPSSEFFTAKRKIAELLGPFSAFLIEYGVGWGPGATDDLRRREAALDTKIHKVPISVTRGALPYLDSLIRADLHWSAALLGVAPESILGPFSFIPDLFSITDRCVIDLVPKNAKAHRVIAKEPRGNAFLQKGIGSYIRKRLQRVGIDLDSQEANQVGASCAYNDGLATIDLKAASDSVSLELVYELLPVDWAIALEDLRSPCARLPDGSVVKLEKISSMGNGFTFELETLLFWALASSVKELNRTGGRVLVYGDDIIVPRVIASDLISVLAFAGFETNHRKTFIEGNFFESCGRHYFQGVEVTPIYQKALLDEPEELIRAGNRLIRYAFRTSGTRLNRVVFRAWNACRKGLDPSLLRFQIPLGSEGDDGWVVPATHFDAVGQDVNLGLRCRVCARSVRSFPAHEPSLLAWSLRRGSLVVRHPFDLPDPFWGQIEFPPLKDSPIESRRRWVMPSGDFGLTW